MLRNEGTKGVTIVRFDGEGKGEIYKKIEKFNEKLHDELSDEYNKHLE